MRAQFQGVADAGHRVDQFFTRRAAVVPKTSAAPARRQLATQVGILEEAGSQQTAEQIGVAGAVSLKETLRDLLFRQHLTPVITVANTLLRNETAFAGLVAPRQNLGTGALLNEVKGIVKALHPFVDQFVANGFDPDFLDQIVGAANAVRLSVEAGTHSRANRINATSSVDVTALEVKGLIRALDRMVRAEAHGNTALIKEWTDAKRIPRSSRAKAVTPDAAPANPSPEVTTPAA